MRSRWEYDARELRLKSADFDDEHLLAWLNRRGAEGWELVHLYAIGGPSGRYTWHGVFKRARGAS